MQWLKKVKLNENKIKVLLGVGILFLTTGSVISFFKERISDNLYSIVYRSGADGVLSWVKYYSRYQTFVGFVFITIAVLATRNQNHSDK